MTRNIEYASDRLHRRSLGPAALFGRGRIVSVAVMLSLLAIASLSRPNDLTWQRDSTNSGPQTSYSTIELVAISPLSDRPRIERSHLGLLSDGRAELVQQVGTIVSQAVEAPVGTIPFRFGLLADEMQRHAYCFEDGWILTTVGLVQMAHVESEVAAILALLMESVARAHGLIDGQVAPGRRAAEWLGRAGFDPKALETIQNRLAENNDPASNRNLSQKATSRSDLPLR